LREYSLNLIVREVRIRPCLVFGIVRDSLPGPRIPVAGRRSAHRGGGPAICVGNVNDRSVDPDCGRFAYGLAAKLVIDKVKVNIDLNVIVVCRVYRP
jgi:hypothetical protein